MTIAGEEKHALTASSDEPASILAWFRRRLARRSQRIELRDLNDSQLRDLGLTPADAERDAARLPWDGQRR